MQNARLKSLQKLSRVICKWSVRFKNIYFLCRQSVMDHMGGERIVVNQENKKERGVNVWNTLKLQKKIWK